MGCFYSVLSYILPDPVPGPVVFVIGIQQWAWERGCIGGNNPPLFLIEGNLEQYKYLPVKHPICVSMVLRHALVLIAFESIENFQILELLKNKHALLLPCKLFELYQTC